MPLSANLNLYQQFLWEKTQWNLERKQFLKVIKDQVQQLEEKDNEIQVLQQKVTKMTELVPELLSCRSPSLAYILLLKE